MIEAKIPYQATLQWNNGQLKAVGSMLFLERIQQYKKKYGPAPDRWPLVDQPVDGYDLLINEFVDKINQTVFPFNHDELCHCRAVKTQKVRDAIKAGCQTQPEVTRTTLAGSGCGSCRKDIDEVIGFLKNPRSS